MESLFQAENQKPLLKLDNLTVLYLFKLLQQKSVLSPYKKNTNRKIWEVSQCYEAELPDFQVTCLPSGCFESQWET